MTDRRHQRAPGISAQPPRLLLSEHDVYLLNEGTFERAYERFGAHVREVDGVTGVHFVVWAPNARRVSVVGSFNDWDATQHPMVRHGEGGIWECFVPGVGSGAQYKYHIESRYHAYVVDKADPYAFAAERLPGTGSVVCDLDGYEWGDAEWMAVRDGATPRRADGTAPGLPATPPISIYEVHIGSWRRVPGEGDRPLTYRELAHQLVPYVQELGFTHVELMPVMEHPFDQSWGYQITGYYAPTARYGTPQDFMYFVDYCHRHGVGVILDWVPAHFAKEGHGLGFFDGTHLYEHADPRRGEQPTWGTFLFNHGRAEVRNFLLANALFWLDRYHVDGFRVDAVAIMVWLDHGRPESHWTTNQYGGRENLDATDFLRRCNDLVHRHYPGALMLGEEATTYLGVTQPTYAGGLGFDYKWSLGWMHDTLAYLEVDPIYRRYAHDKLTWPIWYAFQERHLLPLSHDEVVHLKKSLLSKMHRDAWQQFANLRALFAYQYSHPGKKLLFMGGEFGQWAEWRETRSLDWHLLEDPCLGYLHRGAQWLVADLNRLYAGVPALHELDVDPHGFEWIDHRDVEQSVIAYLRRGRAPSEVVVVCNFTPVPRSGYRIGVPEPGAWREVLNTDDPRYGGSGVLNSGVLQTEPAPWHGRPQSLVLSLPPLGVVFLQPAA